MEKAAVLPVLLGRDAEIRIRATPAGEVELLD
ncbi:hypothetical protein ABIB27_003617 [Arthrobacter sp. UYEF21]